MGIIKDIREVRRVMAEARKSGASTSDVAAAVRKGILSSTGGTGILGGTYDFGTPVTNDSAMKLTAYYAAIRVRSENIASLPRTVKQRTEDGLVSVPEHPVWKLIRQKPNPYTNDFDFWFSINAALDGWGNAYAIIVRGTGGTPVALHQVHPKSVTVYIDGNGLKMYKVSDTDRPFLNGVYLAEDMLHFMLVTYNGLIGVNPVVANAIALGKSLAVEKFSAEYYRKGGEVKAVLETEGSLGDTQYKNFMSHYSAAAENCGTPLLEYGIKYKPVGINPVAAALVQSETFSINDIARITNMPPHMLCEMTHSTFSNIEHQTLQFVTYSIRPTVKRLETELERKLLFDDEREDISIKFSLEGLLRGDTSARAAFYHSAINDGYMSRNEVRELEGLQHLDGLDDMLYPLNLGREGQDEPNNNE